MIVLVATMICLLALLFAPQKGIWVRVWRIAFFRDVCICENILKTMWRIDPKADISLKQMNKYQAISHFYLHFILYRMVRNGWIGKRKGNMYYLTADGRWRAAKIVRLHRLWEVYLANYLGVGVERVHRNAEEIEHILTPELEQELIRLLKDPLLDPHRQPIPREALHVL